MFWKKINRGVAVTVIIIIGVIIYLIALEAVRASEKPNIEKTCRNYIEEVASSYLLPAEYRSGETKISENQLNDCIATAKENIRKYYIDGSISYTLQADDCENTLRLQAEAGNIIESLEKEFVKIESISYNKNTVEVRLNYRTRFSIAPGGKDELITTYETVFLQKADNEWKVTYSVLDFSFYASYINTKETEVFY